MSPEDLIARGQRLLDSDLSGPPAFNQWRKDVLDLLSKSLLQSDAARHARSTPRAEAPKNLNSGRGLRTCDRQSVAKLILALEELRDRQTMSPPTANWIRVFNRLFEIINRTGATYYSGPRFISAVREIDAYFPDYTQYVAERKEHGKSTTRKDFFYDILLSLPEPGRARLVLSILDQVGHEVPDLAAGVRDELGGKAGVPIADVGGVGWNADRLQEHLMEIDARIAGGKYAGAVTLCYTSAEGFLKAFIRSNIPNEAGPHDIVSAGKVVQTYLRQITRDCPDEVPRMINHICHTVDRSRNGFSESHFDEEASRWLSVFMRDLTNSLARLLLHFIRREGAEPDATANPDSAR